mmetsp:Transcript_148526/g.274020  ORF Transcript_148526/g.274020 Transcript_148526/m.274020 type:complete len:231 (-) Transcript_148526:785-1477(-)
MVFQTMHKLSIELVEKAGRIRRFVELPHEKTWKGSILRAEAKEHSCNSGLHLIDEGSEGVGVIEDSKLAAQLLLVLSELFPALLCVWEDFEHIQLELRSLTSLALWPKLQLLENLGTLLGLCLCLCLRLALDLGFGLTFCRGWYGLRPRRCFHWWLNIVLLLRRRVFLQGVAGLFGHCGKHIVVCSGVLLISDVQNAEPPHLSGLCVGLSSSLSVRQVDKIGLPTSLDRK